MESPGMQSPEACVQVCFCAFVCDGGGQGQTETWV